MTNLLARVKISVKVLTLLLLLGIVTVGVAFVGSRTIISTDDSYSVLVNTKLPITTKVARANRSAMEMPYAGYRALAYPNNSPEGRAAVTAESDAYKRAVQLLGEAREADPTTTDEMTNLIQQVDNIHALTAKAVALGAAGQKAEASALLEEADKLIIPFAASILKGNEKRIADASALSTQLSDSSDSTSRTMIIGSIVAVLFSIGLAFLVSRIGITAPLNRLQESMRTLAGGNNRIDIPGVDRGDEVGAMAQAVLVFRDAAVALEGSEAEKQRAEAEQRVVVEALENGLGHLAEGDLTVQINEDFAPSYLTIKTNFNDALNSLRELIGSVMDSASSIRVGSVEIAQASEDLARRTESNAANLEETSAAIAQIDERLRETAAAAGRTVSRADQAIATVVSGRAVADDAVQAMGRVADSAKGIDSVIEGLDKIAFQTRVLAMNAAVEAGRAGDAGRGFAVVADLVSALAMRAEEEAKRARDQLTVTQAEIVTAVDSVQKVDGALANISGDVGEVHTLLDQMATDNQAQASSITEISTAVSAMDHATQQNAAMVEQTSAAARNLSNEVESMSETASRFQIGDTGRAPGRASAAKQRTSITQKHAQTPMPSAAHRNGADQGNEAWNAF